MFRPSKSARRHKSKRGTAGFPARSLSLGLLALMSAAATAHAGDNFRRGAAAAAPAAVGPSGPAAGGDVTAAQAQAIRQRAQESLRRTTLTLGAVQAMQSAARAAALAQGGLVPNGLTTGGLEVHPGVAANPSLWQGANLPVESSDDGVNVNVTIKQTAQQALLNWSSFNVGQETTLTFDQSAGGADKGQWVAFNKVTDPTGVPSRILGSIKADGQVYVINQNGIIFGGASQINVHALTASTLAINDTLVSRGLLNNPDTQYLFSATTSDPLFGVGEYARDYTINSRLLAGTKPQVRYSTGLSYTNLVADVDYNVASDADGKTVLNFTAAGLAKVGTGLVNVTYTPAQIGDVIVERGAQIVSPTSADKVGGRVALVGPRVSNAGTISTPDGQTILAAGLEVGMAAHNGNDASLRGLDAYVGKTGSEGGVVTLDGTTLDIGTATNAGGGLIDAPRASVIITGKNVNQDGAIDSSTSVSRNGRIDLLASYDAVGSGGFSGLAPFLYKSTGTVSLGAGSMTRILPEWASSEKVVGTSLALGSQVNASGLVVHFGEDSTFYAPSAGFKVNAGRWSYAGSGASATSTFVTTAGQIYVDENARIDVSGSTDVAASVADNFISVQLRAAELANSPLQRNGALRGQTIQVDTRVSGTYNGVKWVGTPLADTSGYVALMERNVGQLTTGGGSVQFNAGGSVVLQSGSEINVSGGWINYAGANVQTSAVVSNGQVFDISLATPDRVYSGLYKGGASPVDSKWNVAFDGYENTLQAGLHYEAGYLQGGGGGSLSITAPAMALDGGLAGLTVSGPRQRSVLPAAGTLSLAFQAQFQDPANSRNFLIDSLTPPALRFEKGVSLPAAAPFAISENGTPSDLSAARKAEVVLPPSLFTTSGFGDVSIGNSEGDVRVVSGSALNLPAGGSLTITAANLFVEDSITAPGGTLDFTATNISQGVRNDLFSGVSGAASPGAAAGRGAFVLADGVGLSTAGLTVNDSLGWPAAGSKPLKTAGGSISIRAYDASFGEGGLLDVSGGVAVSASGKFSYGSAGKLSVLAGQDANIASVLGGKLLLDPARTELRGFSGSKGGSITLQAPLVRLGEGMSDGETLSLDSGFFSENGFSSFTLRGLGKRISAENDEFVPGLVIAPGAVVAPEVTGLVAALDPDAPDGVALNRLLQPEGLRNAASLSFVASGVRDTFNPANPLSVRGDLVVGQGARVETDGSGSVSFRADTVKLSGVISAPGGTITVSGSIDSDKVFPFTSNGSPVDTVLLDSTSSLSTAGKTVLIPDTTGMGYRTGSVLAGGSIRVSGNINARPGSLVDVSGASGVLDLDPFYSARDSLDFGRQRLPVTVDSNAGSVTFAGAQQLRLDATLRGQAGGDSAQGGSLAVSSGVHASSIGSNFVTPLTVTLDVVQSGESISSGRGYVVADGINAGGFDTVTLAGTPSFHGDVSLSASRSLAVGDGGVIYADGTVSLSAPSVKLGTGLDTPHLAGEKISAFSIDGDPFNFSPTHGAGSLVVEASRLIDIGNLSMQGIGGVLLDVTGGDLRGAGTFNLAGDLLISAGQVYPVTATAFTISVSDYQDGETVRGSISLLKGDDRPVPFSAGGSLNLYASTINQGGTLRAPAGTINLGWSGVGSAPVDLITGQPVSSTASVTLGAGSQTSVSNGGLTLPYGVVLNGSTWIDPTGRDITITGAPAKAVNVAAESVVTEAGSSIDTSGGGDLYAYRWVSGTGGTVDVLSATSSFAVLPAYSAGYAPYAPFNSSVTAKASFGSDTGYANAGLAVGDQVYLAGGGGLAAGNYTLLPARYALLPGAFLVTPKSGGPVGLSSVLPDGSAVVSGYRFNSLQSPPENFAPLRASFEVASSAVVRARAEYENSLANTFLPASAARNNVSVSRLPVDAGQLVFSATQAMTLKGAISAGTTGGRGGLIDIDSPVDILIGGAGDSGAEGQLVLDAGELGAYSGASILIGGSRQNTTGGTAVSVNTKNLTVAGSGTVLSGADLILVSKERIGISDGAVIEQRGTLGGSADSITLGSAQTSGSGNGALVRVGGGSAGVSRAGVDADASTSVSLSVGSGAVITGGSGLTFDSTGATTFAETASFGGKNLSISSGRISLQLSGHGELQSDPGLVLSDTVLGSLQRSTEALSLLSYTSVDIYGTGEVGSGAVRSLALHTPLFRGFSNGSGAVQFTAKNIQLDAGAGAASSAATGIGAGSLVFNASQSLVLGDGVVQVGGFSDVKLAGAKGILATGKGGVSTSGDLVLDTPLLAGAKSSDSQFTASGFLRLVSGGPAAGATVTPGLGAKLGLTAPVVSLDGNIALPSGALSVRATAGDLQVGGSAAGTLDVGGTAQQFFDVTRFTDGGTIALGADHGSIFIGAAGGLRVAANAGGGDAGSVSVSAPSGTFVLNGTLAGGGGTKGAGGSFSLDEAALSGTSIQDLNSALDAAGFNLARTFRIRSGDVLLAGTARASAFKLSADAGSIVVTGQVDASGPVGGYIGLSAAGSVTLDGGALLDVSAADFNSAGKGGAVFLSAGAYTGGPVSSGASVELLSGSTVDLRVDSLTSSSAAQGRFSGTLELRAPQSPAHDDVQVAPIEGDVLGASRVVVSGYNVIDLASTGGVVTGSVKDLAAENVSVFGDHAAAISARLLSARPELAPVLSIRPDEELVNLAGDITLASAWDLSGLRSGADRQPGTLTIRASGDLVFAYDESTLSFGSLSDGFSAAGESAGDLWLARLMEPGTQSWSYRLIAGADFGSAEPDRVLAAADSAAYSGSLLLGKGSPELPNPFGGSVNVDITENIVPAFYQVIRTGTGDININAAGDVRLLNPLATIYTAGTRADDMADFDTPNTGYLGTSSLGAIQQSDAYSAQYSLGGGNVVIRASRDITRLFEIQGEFVDDSTLEMPTNWLYRRGAVDPATGQFATTRVAGNGSNIASTTWWTDFSNFFQDVATLGGGNVELSAGRDVRNVSASAATNARMPKGSPSAESLLELGGGDVTVSAGRNLDGGVYYVERGAGSITAGASIVTNGTRSTLSLTDKAGLGTTSPDPSTWLPTTLFAGKAGFTVSAHDDVLLGQVANPFLLPQGVNNSYFNKSYFSTYASGSFVEASSLTGDLALRAQGNGDAGSLQNWYHNILVFDDLATSNTFARTVSTFNQPWLRLAESLVEPLSTGLSLMPGRVSATAFAGDVNLLGNLLIAPSATGTVELVAKGSVNALQRIGLQQSSRPFDRDLNPYVWSTASINLSDADPAKLPGVATPFGYGIAGTRTTSPTLFENSLNPLFNESGSSEGVFGVIQTRQALHTPGLLHAADDTPAYVYAAEGDVSGLTLFSSKFSRVSAGRDVTDVGLYLQNNRSDDLSVVTAGRDIVAYNTNSALRTQARADGNVLLPTASTVASPASGNPNSGDIQIGGSGALHVQAGRNLDLGATPGSADPKDGTAVGITSIGNARNPYLPSSGASVTVAAGLGGSQAANYAAFNHRFLDPAATDGYAARYLPQLAKLMNLSGATAAQTWTAFNALPSEQRDSLSLSIFYTILRDAGRDHGNPDAAGFGTYAAGDAAIAALFPGSKDWSGDVSLSSREIRTTSGGDIRVLAPGGGLILGFDTPKRASAPPGIVTERGGAVSIYTRDDVNIGVLRIFTLRGGDIVIWSSLGDIAAGFSSKTIQSAAPTRVLIDPQSGDVKTDLAGLATGGGIGVLATVAGVKPGDVDLIAPTGTIDAGDAGIRSTGNLNISALVVLNAANIQAGGSTSGVPAVSAPSLGGLSVASTTPATSSNSVAEATRAQSGGSQQEAMPSLISVEVMGYGGGDPGDTDSTSPGGEDKEEEKKKEPKAEGGSNAGDQLTRREESSPASAVPAA